MRVDFGFKFNIILAGFYFGLDPYDYNYIHTQVLQSEIMISYLSMNARRRVCVEFGFRRLRSKGQGPEFFELRGCEGKVRMKNSSYFFQEFRIDVSISIYVNECQ